jgi:hypothetical protein
MTSIQSSRPGGGGQVPRHILMRAEAKEAHKALLLCPFDPLL